MKFIIRLKAKRFIILKDENPQWPILLSEGIGKNEDGYLSLHPIECAYLLFKNRATVESNKMTLQALINKFSEKDPLFMRKFAVYLDLKERKFTVRVIDDGVIDFEVFEKFADALMDESKKYVKVVPAEYSINIDLLEKGIERASKNGKQFVLCIIDQEGDLVYYAVNTTLDVEVILKLRK